MINVFNEIASHWFDWQFAMLWQTAVLIGILWIVDLAIRKWAWPQVRYALWMLVLVKLLIPPTFTSPASVTSYIPDAAIRAAILAGSGEQANTETPGGIASPVGQAMDSDSEINGTQASSLRFTEHGQDARVPLNTAGAPDAEPTGAATVMERAGDAAPSLSWKVYSMFVWLTGIAILSAWLILRLRGLRKEHVACHPGHSTCHPGLDPGSSALPERFNEQLKTAGKKLKLKRLPQVIFTDKVAVPAVFGVFRPVLLIPRSTGILPVNHGQACPERSRGDGHATTDTQTEHILLHELAHIKRGDLVVHAVYMLLQIVYWFNPLLWLMRKTLQNLRELCCDATVARLLREDTVHYRQTLLETARRLVAEPVDPGLGLLGLFENNNWLLTRLKWLEKQTWKNRRLRIATIIALVTFMTACVLPMANRTKELATEDTENKEFIKTLDNGVTVELIAVREHPDKQWWTPDGIILVDAPDTTKAKYDKSVLFDEETERKLEIVYQSSWPDLPSKNQQRHSWKVEIGRHQCRILSHDAIASKHGEHETYTFVIAVPDELKADTAKASAALDVGAVDDSKRQWVTFKDVALRPGEKTEVDTEMHEGQIRKDEETKVVSASDTIIERTLHAPRDNMFDVDLFDFCTNTVFDIPGDLKFWDYPKWYAEHGIDVICIPSKQGPTLSGDGRISGSFGNYGGNLCKFVKTDVGMDCSALDMDKAWQSGQSMETTEHGGWDNLPARFFFKSRDGDSGILEITAIDEREKSITFKYKLFEADKSHTITHNSKPTTKDYELQTENFTATLPNGVTVELVGLGTAPWKEEQHWWKPDGANMTDPELKFPHLIQWKDQPNGWQFACTALCRFSTDTGKEISVPDVKFSNNALLARVWGTDFTADGYEMTYIAYNPSMGTVPAKTDVRLAVGCQMFVPAKRLGHYTPGQHQMYYLGDNKDQVILHPLRIGSIGTPCVDLTCKQENREIEFRVVAKLKNGETEKWSGGSIGKDVLFFQSTPKRKNTKIEDIEDIIIEYRPYEWITFKNVALRPGEKTEVEINMPRDDILTFKVPMT